MVLLNWTWVMTVGMRKPRPRPLGDNGQYSGKRLFIMYLKCRWRSSCYLGRIRSIHPTRLYHSTIKWFSLHILKYIAVRCFTIYFSVYTFKILYYTITLCVLDELTVCTKTAAEIRSSVDWGLFHMNSGQMIICEPRNKYSGINFSSRRLCA